MRRNEMIKKCILIVLLCVSPLVFIAGCNKDFGKVDQGRVIEYDKEKRIVTFIRDVKADPGNPDYSHLPPLTYEMPKDLNEIMGAEPKAGYRMKLDTKKSQVIIYDPAEKKFKAIDYKLIDQKELVEKDSPLVFDQATKKEKQFPIVDKEKRTITIYSKRLKILSTFTVSDEYFALPEKSWEAGDEVRVYYKEDGKSLRFMNISRTETLKK
jgi:hypothetical protein